MFAARPQRAHWSTFSSCKRLAATVVLVSSVASAVAMPLPSSLRGTWRITRVLPTRNTTCWGSNQAAELVGSTLTYLPGEMRWKGGSVPVREVATRSVSAEEFAHETGSEGGGASFNQVGIRSGSVLEVNLQHEDMDITGATTEVPGDAVLLAGPNRIVVSACGVYFEATRAGLLRASR